MPNKKTHEDFVEEMKIKHPNLKILGKYINSQTKILIQDELGIEYTSRPYTLSAGSFPTIEIAVDKTDAFKKKLKLILPNLIVLGEYIELRKKIMVQDNLGIKYMSSPYCLLIGQTPSIVVAIDKNLAFKIIAEKTHGKDKFDYSNSIYKAALIYTKILCKKCNNIFSQKPAYHWMGQGCPSCHIKRLNDISYDRLNKRALTISKDIERTHNNRINCDKLIYKGNKVKSFFGCNVNKNHGYWLSRPNDILSGYGCPLCNTSKGEYKVIDTLKKLNVIFTTQKTFEGCKDEGLLRFDTYISYLNTCIEYDGILHYKKVDFFGGECYYNDIKKKDKIKNEYCKKNNIGLLRIPYTEFKNIEKIVTNLIEKTKEN